MKQRLYLVPVLLFLIILMANCAKKGTPSGGPKDTIPPIIVKSAPENFSINFDQNEIRISFDEYIKLKDLQQNLIISPPLKYDPIITPTGTSKQLRIKILDTLAPNTTYSINFGRSIVDNNEENEYDYYKYVFSTGDYIDSLVLKGRVKDGLLPKIEESITLMLHEIDSSYTDSTIYFEKPTYITTTRDSTGSFELTNLKEGRYMLMALQEKSNDYTFQPQTDKIGFWPEPITLPTEESFDLTLFKEIPDFEMSRPEQLSKFHIVFGYMGDGKELEIKPISELPADHESLTLKDLETDSLHYWYKPEITLDTLYFNAKNAAYEDSLVVRMKSLFPDSLKLSGYKVGTVKPRDTMSFRSTTPIVAIDTTQISIVDKDTIGVAFSAQIDPSASLVNVTFDKTDDQRYTVSLFPGAVTDFYEAVNDSTEYVVQTKALSDYGTLTLTLENVASYPVIVQLVNEKMDIQKEEFVEDDWPVEFDYITPGRYYLRIIDDKNGNGIWDTGSLLKRIQPEVVKYYPVMLDIRANWSLNERFKLN